VLTVGLETSFEVGVPVRAAYDRWTRFESFPRFMPLVRRVEQVRPNVTRWWVGRGLLRHEFYAEVVEQHPDDLVAWRSLDRRFPHRGEVRFHALGEHRTEVSLSIEAGKGLAARLPQVALRRLVESQLSGYEAFVEGVGGDGEGDTWRGTIQRGRVENLEKSPPAHPGWVHG
jgi:uncharacterized membrane protein